MSDTYELMLSSRSNGSCCSTSPDASRPSCTSCCGVYLFLGAVIFVCAPRICAETTSATTVTGNRNTRIGSSPALKSTSSVGGTRPRDVRHAGIVPLARYHAAMLFGTTTLARRIELAEGTLITDFARPTRARLGDSAVFIRDIGGGTAVAAG